MRQLRQKYIAALSEQQKTLANISLNHERLLTAFVQSVDDLKKAQEVREHLDSALQDVVVKYEKSLIQQQERFPEFEKNENVLLTLSRDWWQASAMLLDELGVDFKEEYVTQTQQTININRGARR